jgi:hypothetical protein
MVFNKTTMRPATEFKFHWVLLCAGRGLVRYDTYLFVWKIECEMFDGEFIKIDCWDWMKLYITSR